MSDTVKLIIEIPKPMYESVQNGTYCGNLYEELKNGTPLDENKGEWIPVSERLPKIADVYRVTRYYSNNRYIVDACFFDGSSTWHNDNRINHKRGYVDNVIAWQENPEPYEEETKDWVDKEMAKKYGFFIREDLCSNCGADMRGGKE